MKKKLKWLVRDTTRFLLGKKGYVYIRFLFTHRYWGNFKKPLTWNEKIQYRKLYEDPNLFSKLADKYHVRAYVSQTIGDEYLIPLIARFDNISNDDFISLPNKFVLKTSNGGGGENVKVILNKNKEDVQYLSSLYNSYLLEKIGSKIDELFYDIEDPSILVEELIENLDGSTLLDYKFHIFKNESGIKVLLQINSNYKKENETKTLYNTDGIRSEIQFVGYDYGPEKLPLPENFALMIELAIKLSGDLSYSRVDLYNVDGRIYFGEITLCPASGWDRLNDKEYDKLLGSYWKIE